MGVNQIPAFTMGDADADDKPNDGIPEWQRKNETEDNAEDSLVVVRRFLQDEHVKDESRDKKVAFLKAKGIDDSDIEALLGESPASPTESAATETKSTPTPAPAPETTPSQSEPSSPTAHSEPTSHPPVVTYPEFLATPSQPPPLVTTARLLATLQITTLVSTLVVGTSKFVLSPMLESLTASRVELHDDVSGQLDKMLTLLEGTVSTVSTTTKASPSEIQATRLQGFTKSLGEIKEGLRSQSDDISDIKTLVDVFRDDLDALTYKSPV